MLGMRNVHQNVLMAVLDECSTERSTSRLDTTRQLIMTCHGEYDTRSESKHTHEYVTR